VKVAEGSRRLALHLSPAGATWAGKVVLDGQEHAARDIRVETGVIRFGLDDSNLSFEGRRALGGGQVSGVVRGLGTFHLVRE
jgi:hypothetical protein